MRSNSTIETKLAELCTKGLLEVRTENNRSLKVSYKGAGTLVSPKWNVKIYSSGAVVCNDEHTLMELVEGRMVAPSNKKLLQCDDAGIGFPLSGVMIGVTDGVTVWTDTVDVVYFQNPAFENKRYLDEYSKKGFSILQKIGASPDTHRIEICTGFINTRLRDNLRAAGYEVRVTEIKGLLQDQLEDKFRTHVRWVTGLDLGYDPKKIAEKNLGKAYYQVLEWGQQYAPGLLKSGWKSMQGV